MKKVKKIDFEPIAIIGMAFRFPGDLCDEQGLWEALAQGKDVVSEVGPERWATDELQHDSRSEAGRSVTFSAGVISDVESFDAAFFGISPREASWLDPQQRLLLELTWNAMENGGQVPSKLADSNTSVFVGLSSLDYGVKGIADLSSISSHTMTGNTLSMASNRISYAFDLHGPSLTVDTACSSSIVALHQACRNLQSGESPMAIVGSINLLLHPYPFVGFTKASMISSKGRSRTFDASADGYVRSEGGAVLLLKTLSQAKADGDHIHALILGTGVNSDGSRKSGITIPSSEGQAELMRSVLKAADLDPLQIDYLEAHGTGTAVGDPIETKAIGEIYGKERSTPLTIGSVKANMGHLEAASGMAGLVKSVLMLKQQQIPPSLHFENANPNIAFDDLNLEVASECVSRPVSMIALNSFGFGGTNAHALLQSYTEKKKAARRPVKKLPPLFLSAKTDNALQELAGLYAEQLGNPDCDYYDIAYSAAFHREHLEKRVAFQPADKDEVIRNLKGFSEVKTTPEIIQEQSLGESCSVTFVYTGNGAQWLGMGKSLLKQSKRFAAIMKEMDVAMSEQAGFSLLKEILADQKTSRLDDTRVAQPLLFAIQVAITKLLGERGVQPGAVMGHSVGEVAAAWAAGILTLEQAIHVICTRSEAQGKTKGNGRMAAVGLSELAIRVYLDNYQTIEIAGVNSPSNVTISGKLEELQALEQQLNAKNIFFRLLDLDYAFHSRAMDPVQMFFLKTLREIKPSSSKVDFVSTVSGDVLSGSSLTAHYWWDNVRKPVNFAGAINNLIASGSRVFVEIGPHAILQRYIVECLSAAETAGRVLSTLRRGDDNISLIDETALKVHMLQPELDLEAVKSAYFPQNGRFVQLPAYPWQREHYSLPKTSESYGLIRRTRVHPLLGWRLKEHDACWENVLDESIFPYLRDHRVANSTIFPASGYVEMTLAAAQEWYGGDAYELEELTIFAPIALNTNHARSLRLELSAQDGNVRILSRERLSQDAWTVNATCRLLGAPMREADVKMQILDDDAEVIDAKTHYDLAHIVGLDYGRDFQGFAGGAIKSKRLDARLSLPAGLNEGQYILHPVLLDSCFQSLVNFFKDDIEAGLGAPLLPIKVGRLRYYGVGPAVSFRMQIKAQSMRSLRGEFVMLNEAGETVCVLENCVFRISMMQRRRDHQPAEWLIIPKVIAHPSDVVNTVNPVQFAQNISEWLARPDFAKLRKTYFEEAVPLLNALVTAFTYEAFLKLSAKKTNWLNNIPANCREYFQWLLELMQRESLLVKDDNNWRLDIDNAPPPAEEIWRSLLAEFPEIMPELLFIGRIGQSLGSVLMGEQELQALADSVHKSHFLESFFSTNLVYNGIQNAQFEALNILIREWPGHMRLRILHISQIAAELPTGFGDGRVDYVIASADDELLSHLKAKYQGHAFVKVAAINMDDMSIDADSSAPAEFDVVILDHWLHNTVDPANVLASLHHKIATNGQIMILERHENYSANFIFGLEKSWWRNHRSALQAPKEWQRMALEQGFENVEYVMEPLDEQSQSGSYIIVAQNKEKQSILARDSSRWLLISDGIGISKSYADSIAAFLSPQVTVATLSELNNLGRFDHVVYLAGIEGKNRCIDALQLIQALTEGEEKPAKLWIVTSGGAVASGGDWVVNPEEASLWGFGRVVMNEHPALACTLIDMAADIETSEKIRRLGNELLMPDGENEIVLTKAARYGLRLQNKAKATIAQPNQPIRFKLDFQVPGQLRNLLWLEQKGVELQADEVEVETMATGLNFRDVMYVMGMLPDEAVENGFSGASLGLEFSGRVSRVGSGVIDYKAGDSVIGFGPACFASHVITKANAVTFKPDNWSYAQGATVPTAFFTVYYALKTLANVQPGEKVLIHGGAGGVGIAAIQLAKHLGAEVFATAGSDEKRDFVKLLGADHVLDSRSLAFADDILTLTQGEGVDVVLNSLAGEAINRNLRALKPFGRFLELGKRDFFENTHIGLRPFKDNISYFGIDADQLLVARPALAAKLFREMMELFAIGALSPLPYRAFKAENVVEAFRHMQQSRHVGKIVVDLNEAQIKVAKVANLPRIKLEQNASYLVTGGMAGFGLESARYLAKRGAKHLVLLSRQGMDTPDAATVIAELEALGSNCHVFACNITDYEKLANIFFIIKKELPPLRGILHAAMVLDDALISNLTPKRFEKVLAPKTIGAMNLHNLSLEMKLDYFILYSSITTTLGNPGQSNYVAANTYLEGFAQWRRSLGLPAHCIGWGPIGDAGYLTRNAAVKDNLAARLGAQALESKQAFEMLDSIIADNEPNVAVADFAFSSLSRLLPSAQGPRFELLQHLNEDKADDGEGDILSLIAGKSFDEVCQSIQHIILGEVGKILSVSSDRVDISTPLNDLGMDSLMMVELVLAIEQRCGINFSAMELSGSANSIERIVKRVAEKLYNKEEKQEGDTLENLVDLVISQHEGDLSDKLLETVEDVKKQNIAEQAA